MAIGLNSWERSSASLPLELPPSSSNQLAAAHAKHFQRRPSSHKLLTVLGSFAWMICVPIITKRADRCATLDCDSGIPRSSLADGRYRRWQRYCTRYGACFCGSFLVSFRGTRGVKTDAWPLCDGARAMVATDGQCIIIIRCRERACARTF
jgi:hypothetical protein